MIGILVIAHDDLAEALEKAATMIFGKKPEGWMNVAIRAEDSPEQIISKVKSAINKMRRTDGLIVFTDMLGGTPSNVALPFVEEGKMELISGVNLPMVIKALQERDEKPLAELAERVKQWGRESIHRASEYLKA